MVKLTIEKQETAAFRSQGKKKKTAAACSEQSRLRVESRAG
jgi:hypothetical protein